MNRSEQVNELATALAKAQGQMEGAKKDSDNPFFRSKYADLASVVDAIRGPFAEHGLSYVQLPTEREGEAVAVETVLLHASGQWISSLTVVPVSKADAQGYGSAMTYARRYGLQAMAGVAPEDDDGNAAAAAKPPRIQQRPGVVAPAQAEREGDALFATPGEDEHNEKLAIMERIKGGVLKLGMTQAEFAPVFKKHTGVDMRPEQDVAEVTLDALTMLLEELRTRYAAQESRKGKK